MNTAECLLQCTTNAGMNTTECLLQCTTNAEMNTTECATCNVLSSVEELIDTSL